MRQMKVIFWGKLSPKIFTEDDPESSIDPHRDTAFRGDRIKPSIESIIGRLVKVMARIV